MSDQIDPKDEIIASLQEQLRQANECAAHWACKYHADENLFNRQNRELAEMGATIRDLQEKAHRWERAFDNADRQYLKKEKEASELKCRFEEFEKNTLNLLNDKAGEIKQLRKALDSLTLWIRNKMKSMGAPPAFSYKVGIYHGMEKVLKKIESSEFPLKGGTKE